MRALILAMLALGGCAGAPAGRIGGGEWRAVDVNGAPVSNGPVTLRLENGRVSGHAGCNAYFGTYRTSSREGLRFGGLGSTKKACEPAAMDQERRFLSILEQVQGYSLYGDGSLSLIAADGRAIRFRRP